MNRLLSTALVAAAIGAGGMLVGCDETVSRETETKVKDDGTVIRKEEKVTQGADGTVTKTETKKVEKPDNDGDGASIKVDVDRKD
jgi:hypothetical protein